MSLVRILSQFKVSPSIVIVAFYVNMKIKSIK